MPIIFQLRVDSRVGAVMENAGIVRAGLIPASDLVGNYGDLFQSHAVQQGRDFVAGWSVRQSFVGDGANDLVADGAVSENRAA